MGELDFFGEVLLHRRHWRDHRPNGYPGGEHFMIGFSKTQYRYLRRRVDGHLRCHQFRKVERWHRENMDVSELTPIGETHEGRVSTAVVFPDDVTKNRFISLDTTCKDQR